MSILGSAVSTSYSLRWGLGRILNAGRTPRNPHAETLARDGVVVLKGLFPADEARKILEENRRRFEAPDPSDLLFSPDAIKVREASSARRDELKRYYFLYIKNYHDKVDVYSAIDPLVAPILRSFYGSDYYYRDIACYRSQLTAVRFQGSYSWHRDNYPPGCLRVMLLLTDVPSEKEGPLTYALGSHRGFKPELGLYGPRVPNEDVVGDYEIMPCTGPQGTIVIFDNNGIHRAGNPLTGFREVINAILFPCIARSHDGPLGLDLTRPKGLLQGYTRAL